MENYECHGQNSSLIRESGLRPPYSASLRLCVCISHTHTASICSPPVILAKIWWTQSRSSRRNISEKGKLKCSSCLRLVCGLSSSVNRAAAVSMLTCHYLIKNWWLLRRGFKLFCLRAFRRLMLYKHNNRKAHRSYGAVKPVETEAKFFQLWNTFTHVIYFKL